MRVESTVRCPGARPLLTASWLGLLVALGACGDGAVGDATVITPVYGDPCQYEECSGHGECSAGADGTPQCECDVGFGGDDCSVCGNGFHIDADDRCVPDRSCADQERNPCGLYGTCDDHLGVISCTCDEGYEGARCELCTSGHERNQRGECVATVLVQGLPQPGTSVPGDDEEDDGSSAGASGQGSGGAGVAGHEGDISRSTCDDVDCGGHGSCMTTSHTASCACDDGYEGAACDGCADGYYRFYATGTCEQIACTGGTPPAVVTDNFDDLAGDPALPSNVCITDGNGTLARGLMTVVSTGGDSDVYRCGPSTLYTLSSPSSPHVYLDAGATLPAKLVFASPVSQVSFDHAAISDTVSIDVLGDGVVVGTISTHRRESGHASYTFPAPITVLSFLSKSATKCTIAFDNVTYQPACP